MSAGKVFLVFFFVSIPVEANSPVWKGLWWTLLPLPFNGYYIVPMAGAEERGEQVQVLGELVGAHFIYFFFLPKNSNL